MFMSYWLVYWHAPASLSRRENGTAIAYAESKAAAHKLIREAIGPWGADTMIPDSAHRITDADIVDWSISSLELNDAREKGVAILEWGT